MGEQEAATEWNWMLLEVFEFGSVRRSLRQTSSNDAPSGAFFISTHQFTHR